MQKLDIINKTFSAQLSENKRKSSLKWASLNIVGLSVILFDFLSTKEIGVENELSIIDVIEIIALTILSCSFISNVITFIYHSFFAERIICENETQKILLNLSNSIVKSPTPQPPKSNINQNDNFSSIHNLSYQKYNEANQNSSFNNSYNMNNSWMNHNNSSQFNTSMNREKSNINADSFSSPPKFKPNEFIQDKNTMEKYLKEVSQHEKELQSAIEAQQTISGYVVGSNFSSFWGNYRFDEVIASLKTSLYQLSPHNNKQNPLDENYMSKDQENNSELIRKMSANKLSNYTANLKMWISKTILEPVVAAIDDVDKAFQQRGFTDMRIGIVGLERLKKIAATNQHLIQNIPTLPKLIPFLELTTNQEYLVKRIRELSKGSCLKNYKFNSNQFLQPDQPDNIPSDAAIIFHLFCTYLDSQLHPSPDIPRAFYSRYVIVGDVKKTNSDHLLKEVSKNKGKCGIVCSNPVTPKFNFISSEKVHTSSYDRNNLFYVIIQFIMHLKKSDENLESVDLGKSGINIANVIED